MPNGPKVRAAPHANHYSYGTSGAACRRQANSASRQSKQLVAEGVGAWPPTRRLSFRLSSGPSGLLPVCLPLRWLLILDAWTSNADLHAYYESRASGMSELCSVITHPARHSLNVRWRRTWGTVTTSDDENPFTRAWVPGWVGGAEGSTSFP